MGIFEGCLLACDVDGTLLFGGSIDSVDIEKIRFFVSEGGKFSLATGRTVSAVNTVLPYLSGLLSPCIVANGGMIYDYEKEQVLYQALLEKEDHKIAEKILSLGQEIGIEVHSGKRVMVLNRTDETDDHEEYEAMPVEFVPFSQVDACRWNKAIFMLKDVRALATVKDVVAATPSSSEFVETMAVIYDRPRLYYEQLPKGVSKATAAFELCKILDIDPERCFAIGDYYNDLEMIENAAVGAALSDSPDDVKLAADYIAVPKHGGAVADFIDFLAQKGSKEWN